jgi:hypothetical protein
VPSMFMHRFSPSIFAMEGLAYDSLPRLGVFHFPCPVIPRPLHNADDYAAARQAIEPLLGFEDLLNLDQVDYLEAVSSFVEAYDAARVKWPQGKPQNTLKFLLDQQARSSPS